MPQYTIENGPISVTYGYDFPIPGVFLAVVDNRLRYDKNASEEVNSVTESVGIQDGGGSYFNIYTGLSGFGTKVSDQTMATYLRRYNVSEEAIELLPLVLPRKERTHHNCSSICSVCKVPATLTCKSCKSIKYCGVECQRADWSIHKMFCGVTKVNRQLKVPGRRVVVLLPEQEVTPMFVSVPVDELVDGSHYIPHQSSVHSYQYAFGDRDARYAFGIYFQEDFLRDTTTKLNVCFSHICKLKNPGFENIHHWRGNLLIVKELNCFDSGEYFDMGIDDIPSVVDFLLNLVKVYA